jgi:multidrug efflux pump subunit AcrA (membrane-fusion protein)
VKVIPQVSGALTDAHPDLAVGNRISKGEVLFQVDASAYASRVVQIEAEIKALRVLLELRQSEEESLVARLGVARKQLALATSDSERSSALRDQGAATQAEVDAAQLNCLQLRDKVAAYEGQLSLTPHHRAEIEAQIAASQARLADARRDLDNTTIRCPFDARVDAVAARESQVVVAGSVVAILTDLEAFELAAVLSPSDLQWMRGHGSAETLGHGADKDMEAALTWVSQAGDYSWTGRVRQLARYDEITRTARLVIEIANGDAPTAVHNPLGEPRLSIGMFCQVDIPTAPVQDALVVPRTAIHGDNTVYVFEPDASSPDGTQGWLALRRVPMLRAAGPDVLIDFAGRSEGGRLSASASRATCELAPGDLVVVSPLPRPVQGMRLRLGNPAEPQSAGTRVGQLAARTGAEPDASTLHQPAAILVAPAGPAANPSRRSRLLDG